MNRLIGLLLFAVCGCTTATGDSLSSKMGFDNVPPQHEPEVVASDVDTAPFVDAAENVAAEVESDLNEFSADVNSKISETKAKIEKQAVEFDSVFGPDDF